MAVRHEWQRGGGSLALPQTDVLQTVDLTPVYGTRLVKFMVKDVSIIGKNSSTLSSVIENLAIHWEVVWPGTAEFPDTIFSTSRRIPMDVTAFFADAVDVWNVWWTAGDLEMGFSETCSRGKHSVPPPTPVRLNWNVLGPGTFNYEGLIAMDYTFAALWDYLAP